MNKKENMCKIKMNKKSIEIPLPPRRRTLMSKPLLDNNKKNFSSTCCLQTDNDARFLSLRPKVIKVMNLKDEKILLNEDKSLIGDAVRAASKYDSQQIPEEHEKRALESIKENYPAFFESDSEEEESQKGPPSLLGKLMQVKSYLNSELKTNQTGTIKTKQEIASVKEPEPEPVNISDPKGKKRAIDPIEDDSRKIARVSEIGESSSKKEIKSFNDFIDEIYSDYNPFDDIGND